MLPISSSKDFHIILLHGWQPWRLNPGSTLAVATVFSLNSKHRIQITPVQRGEGRGQAKAAAHNGLEKTPEERHRAMTRMQRLKRVFDIDIETCEQCGRKVKVMASIEAPAVLAPILKYLRQKEALKADIQSPERPPPVMRLFD